MDALTFPRFAQAMETCFRGMLEYVSNGPPKGRIGAAIYRHVPALQQMVGHSGPIGYMWLDADIAKDAREARTALPAAPTRIPGDMSDPLAAVASARVIGNLEERMGIRIDDLFERWLHATRRRDSGTPAILLFCSELGKRATGFDDTPMPGVGAVPACQWSVFLDMFAIEGFAVGAGQCLMRLDPHMADPQATLEGARLCGRLEAVAGKNFEDIWYAAAAACEKGVDYGRDAKDILFEYAGAVTAEVEGGVRSPWFDSRPGAHPGNLPGHDRAGPVCFHSPSPGA